ncbi:MAG: helix-turn-helix domain-containing protein [Gammaproteobacteria bacterium]|nr:helix-turn-helix domain-containing protein [Gammaproteobacteria bacterium]
MSIAAMNWAWRQELAPTPKLVLLSLADAADDHGVCWPSVPTVARKCRISPRTVRRIILMLVALGLLFIETRLRPNESRTSNRYVLAMRGDTVSRAPVTDDSTPGQRCQGAPDTHDRPRTTKRTVTEPPPQDPESMSLAPVIVTSADPGGGDLHDLVYPKDLIDAERAAVKTMLDGLPSELAQQLLDELAGRMASGKIHGSPLAYLRGLIKRARRGTFTPEAALRVAEIRHRRQNTESIRTQAAAIPGPLPLIDAKSDDNPLVRRLAEIWRRSRKDGGDGQ